MTKEEFAKQLNMGTYGMEITRDEAEQAKAAGLVVVFGYSDDNMEFRGAINDELGCCDGGIAYLDESDIFAPWNFCDSYNEDSPCKFVKMALKQCKTIEAIWCAPDSPAWTYKTDIPHATFDIMEDGEVYCRGIVFSVEDLKQSAFDSGEQGVI